MEKVEETVRYWFTDRPVTALNIFTVSVILSKTSDKEILDSNYIRVLEQLEKDGKIDKGRIKTIRYEYNILQNNGILDEMLSIIHAIANNPNLITEGQWVYNNTISEAANNCFPCKSRSMKKLNRK